MFLPEVTNIRSPITFAPVVSPTSCWIEPRYSTLSDITASGPPCAAAGAAAASTRTRASRVARSDVMRAPTRYPERSCADPLQALIFSPVVCHGRHRHEPRPAPASVRLLLPEGPDRVPRARAAVRV